MDVLIEEEKGTWEFSLGPRLKPGTGLAFTLTKIESEEMYLLLF